MLKLILFICILSLSTTFAADSSQLQCEITSANSVANSSSTRTTNTGTSDQNTYVYTFGDGWDYHYYKLNKNAKSFSFEVMAESNVWLAFVPYPTDASSFTKDFIEIGLDYYGYDYIRKNLGAMVSKPKTSLSKTEFRKFCAYWNDKTISINQESSSTPIMSWDSPTTLDIQYVGILSYGLYKSAWKINMENQCGNTTTSTATPQTETKSTCWEKPTPTELDALEADQSSINTQLNVIKTSLECNTCSNATYLADFKSYASTLYSRASKCYMKLKRNGRGHSMHSSIKATYEHCKKTVNARLDAEGLICD